MDIDILGMDLAKRVFQLHGADRGGSLNLTQKDNLLELMGRPFKVTGKRS